MELDIWPKCIDCGSKIETWFIFESMERHNTDKTPARCANCFLKCVGVLIAEAGNNDSDSTKDYDASFVA